MLQFSAFRYLALWAMSFLLLPFAAGQASNAVAPPRNPNAVSMIQASLTAMGGSATWSRLHSAIATGTMTSPNNTSDLSFNWTDEWSITTRMKRDNLKPDGTHSLLGQDATVNSSNSSQSTNNPALARSHSPRFDRVTALILHLPAAALAVALDNPQYAIFAVSPPATSYRIGVGPNSVSEIRPPNGTSCARIVRLAQANSPATDVTLCFFVGSNLPAFAKIMVPNLLDTTRPLPETAQYSGFQSTGGVLVPTSVVVTSPFGKQRTLTFTSFSWNPSLSSNAFSEVAQ